MDDEQPWTDAYNEWAAPAEPSPLAGLYLKAVFGAGYQARDAEVSRLQAELRQAREEIDRLQASDLASESARANRRYNDLWEEIRPMRSRLDELEQERTRLLETLQQIADIARGVLSALDGQSRAPVAAARVIEDLGDVELSAEKSALAERLIVEAEGQEQG